MPNRSLKKGAWLSVIGIVAAAILVIGGWNLLQMRADTDHIRDDVREVRSEVRDVSSQVRALQTKVDALPEDIAREQERTRRQR